MSRKFSTLLSLILVVAFALAACGSPTAAPSAPSADQPAQPEATQAPASGGDAPAAENKVTVT